jgi:hypothetical protein
MKSVNSNFRSKIIDECLKHQLRIIASSFPTNFTFTRIAAMAGPAFVVYAAGRARAGLRELL